MTVKIYPHIAGNTLKSHDKFLKKMTKRKAKIVTKPEESSVIMVFCPIASRFETDIQAAIATTPDVKVEVILVAMHHTYDPNYTLPDKRPFEHARVSLLVECLFFEKKGLYKCPRNSAAKKQVCKKLRLSKIPQLRKGKKEKK